MDSDSDAADDVMLPTEDDNDIDERKHNKLLDAITSLDGNKRHKLTQRTVYSNQISEFNFSTSKDSSSRVYLHELVGTLRDSGSHGTLKKQLNTVNKKRQLVSVPLPKHEKEKIDRTTAYESTTVDLSKWDPVVKSNRQADQQEFPLQKADVKLVSSAQFITRFKPRTPLEMQVAALLHGSDHVQSKHQELTPAEQRALRAMDLEEARERRNELCRHRALLSYKEAKAKRQKKIKSKKYHRILKKEKLKTEGKEIEEMKTKDPEGYIEKMKELERARIQERLTLKHRGGSKFARRQMLYAKYNDKARDQVQEMLQMSREITQKAEAASDDNDDDDDAAEENITELVNPTTMVHFSYKGDNPWMAKPQAVQNSLPASKEDQDDEDNGDEEEMNDAVESDKESNEDTEQLTEVKTKTRKIESNKGDSESQDLDSKTNDDGDKIDEIFDSAITVEKKKKKRKRSKGKKKKQESDEQANMVIEELVKSVKAGKKKNIIRDNDVDVADDDDEDDEEGVISEGLSRKRTMEDMNKLMDEAEEPSLPKRSRKQDTNSKAVGKKPEQKTADVSVDPKKLFTLETRIEHTGKGPIIMDADDDEEAIDADEQQRMTIAQAFADDDVIDEFTEEKKEKEDRDKPKDLDLFMPGWGNWGGTGVKPQKKKRKKFIIKAAPGPPRKDLGLGNVIISENKSEAVKKHQVSNIPFPYVNADQFEQSIRAPVGRTWNPETAFKELIKPRVKTQVGAIIAPIDKEAVFKNQKNKKSDLPGNDNTDKNKKQSDLKKKNFKPGQNQKRQGQNQKRQGHNQKRQGHNQKRQGKGGKGMKKKK